MTIATGIEKESLIAYRSYDPKTDEAFLFTSWLNGLYFDNPYLQEIFPKRKDFFFHYRSLLRKILLRPGIEIKMAHLKDDRDTLLGFSCSEEGILHWVYVREEWRRIGLMKDLLPLKHLFDFTSHSTLLFHKHFSQDFFYNPLCLYVRKETECPKKLLSSLKKTKKAPVQKKSPSKKKSSKKTTIDSSSPSPK